MTSHNLHKKYIKKFRIFAKRLREVFVSMEMNRIKEVLEKKGIKQVWLAEQLGKSFNMVNSYVHNRRQPSLETLYKIASILGVEIQDLLLANNEKSKL